MLIDSRLLTGLMIDSRLLTGLMNDCLQALVCCGSATTVFLLLPDAIQRPARAVEGREGRGGRVRVGQGSRKKREREKRTGEEADEPRAHLQQCEVAVAEDAEYAVSTEQVLADGQHAARLVAICHVRCGPRRAVRLVRPAQDAAVGDDLRHAAE